MQWLSEVYICAVDGVSSACMHACVCVCVRVCVLHSCYVKALHINLSRAKWCGMEMRETAVECIFREWSEVETKSDSRF